MKVRKNSSKSKRRSKSNIRILLALAGVIALAAALAAYAFRDKPDQTSRSAKTLNGFVLDDSVPHSIPFDKILSGGPGRDGIPAIDDPKFTSLADARDIPEDTLGMFIELDGAKRYYPYFILVWHEIVNDRIGDRNVAVTFCPLCGSAIIYDRHVEGETVRFGVSGLLYESNLLMYDDKTETLWSQSLGKGVVGRRTGVELERLPTQLLQFREVKAAHPDSLVLSTDTGFRRDYSLNPYGDYDESERLLFDVSVKDTRLPAKTIMYVVPVGDKSLAFEQLKLENSTSRTAEFFGRTITARKDNGKIFVTVDGEEQAGYFEMWFSWATQHQDNGELWNIK